MAGCPPLEPPRAGVPINTEFAYVKRSSAQNQANGWNLELANDPVFGLVSGFTVGVGEATEMVDAIDASCVRVRKRFPLIWVPVEPQAQAPRLQSAEK